MSRVALITGGAKRIGRAIALELAAQGYTTIVHCNTSVDAALRTVRECLFAGAPKAQFLQCNLSLADERASFIAKAVSLFGQLDLLVHSASMFEYDNAASFTAQSLHEHMQTNFLAPVELTMALFAHVQQSRGAPAHVVSLLDQKLFNLNVDYTSYTLAKLANHASIRYLAQCCAPHLRVNAIAPGLTDVSGSMTTEDFHAAHRVAALGKSSTAHDLAQAILMLDNAPAITGQTIVVDGGQHLVPRGRDVAFGD